MILSKSKDFSSEYCARIVKVETFSKHPNPETERLKCTLVGAFSISVSIDAEPGFYLYFPLGCQINGSYLSFHNAFRKELRLNADPAASGFFEKTRKVKAVKLRGFQSEGFIMPYASLEQWLGEPAPEPVEGEEFDTVNDVLFVNRYVIPIDPSSNHSRRGKDGSKKESNLIPGQFKFHYDKMCVA